MAQKETPWFYHPDLAQKYLLPEEARHAGSALRLAVGDRVMLTTGRGEIATARLSEIGKGKVGLVVEEVTPCPEPTHKKTLLIGRMHHVERFEWLVEKCQELGIARLVVVEMERCGVGRMNLERAERIAVSGLKQSHQAWLCAVDYASSLREALAGCVGVGIFGYLADGKPIESIRTYEEAAFAVIGPEADFSMAEVAYMQSLGIKPVSLGATRLRTETAALAAAVHLMF